MQSNAFLALAEQSGEFKDPTGAGRARHRTPEEVLREAREKISKFKMFVTNGTFKPGLRRVGMSRVQFGESEFDWSVPELQRFQESLKPPGQVPEMETPVQVTRTLSRTQSQGGHGFRGARTPQQWPETDTGSAAAATADMASYGQQQEDDQADDGDEFERKTAADAAAPAAAPAVATLRSASSSFRYRSVLGSALETSQLRLALDRLVSEDGDGGEDRLAGVMIPTPPGRAGGLMRREPSQGLSGRGSLDGSWVAQLRGCHSFTAARRQQPGVSAFADGGGGTAGGGGGGVPGGRRPLREACLRTEGTEDGAVPAVRTPDSPGLVSPAREGGLSAAGGAGLHAQRSLLGGGGSGYNIGGSKGMAMTPRGVMFRGPSQTAPQLSLDLSSLELDPVPAKTLSPPAPGLGSAGGNLVAAAAAAGSSGLQAGWTASTKPSAASEAGFSRQSAGRSLGSPSTQSQGQVRMAFPGMRGSLAREEEPRGGSPQLPVDSEQRLVPQVPAVQEEASVGGAAVAKPVPPGTPQPPPPPPLCRFAPCPPPAATPLPAAVVEAAAATGAGAGAGAALSLAPPLGPPRRSVDISSEQLARNAVLAGWSSRRRSDRNLLLNAGGCTSISEPQPQPQQQAAMRSRTGPASAAVAFSNTLRAEGVGWAGAGVLGSSPGGGSDGGSFLLSRDSDDAVVTFGSSGPALRRQVLGLAPGVMSAAAGVHSLRTNSGSSGTTLPVL